MSELFIVVTGRGDHGSPSACSNVCWSRPFRSLGEANEFAQFLIAKEGAAPEFFAIVCDPVQFADWLAV